MQTPIQTANSLDVTDIKQVDAILRSMTHDRHDCYKNAELIDFWLVVRLELSSVDKEENAAK